MRGRRSTPGDPRPRCHLESVAAGRDQEVVGNPRQYIVGAGGPGQRWKEARASRASQEAKGEPGPAASRGGGWAHGWM
jgi:hypothetical protein